MEDTIKALLEAGQVERLHTTPHHMCYNIATHSWGMAALLFKLYPTPPSNQLIKAVLFHDVAERYVGDMPGPAKWWTVPDCGEILQEAEQVICILLGVNTSLAEIEKDWLKALDLLELQQYCWAEEQMGNHTVESIQETCEHLLHGDWVPPEIISWLDGGTWAERTRDEYGAHEILNRRSQRRCDSTNR